MCVYVYLYMKIEFPLRSKNAGFSKEPKKNEYIEQYAFIYYR